MSGENEGVILIKISFDTTISRHEVFLEYQFRNFLILQFFDFAILHFCNFVILQFCVLNSLNFQAQSKTFLFSARMFSYNDKQSEVIHIGYFAKSLI